MGKKIYIWYGVTKIGIKKKKGKGTLTGLSNFGTHISIRHGCPRCPDTLNPDPCRPSWFDTFFAGTSIAPAECGCRCYDLAISLALPNRIDDCERTSKSVYLILSLAVFNHRHKRHPVQEVHPTQLRVPPTLKIHSPRLAVRSTPTTERKAGRCYAGLRSRRD